MSNTTYEVRLTGDEQRHSRLLTSFEQVSLGLEHIGDRHAVDVRNAVAGPHAVQIRQRAFHDLAHDRAEARLVDGDLRRVDRRALPGKDIAPERLGLVVSHRGRGEGR